MSHLMSYQINTKTRYYNIATSAGITTHGKARPGTAAEILHIFRTDVRYQPDVNVTFAVPRTQCNKLIGFHIIIKITKERMGSNNTGSAASIGSCFGQTELYSCIGTPAGKCAGSAISVV